MDKRLLDILCDPLTHAPVQLLRRDQLDAVNQAIAAGAVATAAGAKVTQALGAGLVTADGKSIYRIEDDIPVMLADESISLAQIARFPA